MAPHDAQEEKQNEMDIKLEELTQEQQSALFNLQRQANWFNRFFMRQADRILADNKPRSDI